MQAGAGTCWLGADPSATPNVLAVRLQRQQLPVLEALVFSPLHREVNEMGADVRSREFGSDKDLDQNIKQKYFWGGKFLGGSELYEESGLPGILKIKRSHSMFSSPTV